MKVSICIPVYGVENFIERCAVSVFEQTYENIEYVFVNDCTKDRSIDILEQTILRYPHRSIHINIVNHLQNKGLAGARNTAVESATGEFIFWLDSDDYIDRTAIEKLVSSQRRSNSDIVISDFLKLRVGHNIYISQKNTSNPKEFLRKMLKDECEHWLAGKLIRRSLYIDNKIKAREGTNMGEDFQVCPQLMLYANIISYVEEPLYIYDMTNECSYGHSIKEHIQWQRWETYEEIVSHLPSLVYDTELEYQKLQMVYFQLKSFYLNSENLSLKYYNFLIDRLIEVSDATINKYTIYKRVFVRQCLKYGRVRSKKELPINRMKTIVLIIDYFRALMNYSRFITHVK